MTRRVTVKGAQVEHRLTNWIRLGGTLLLGVGLSGCATNQPLLSRVAQTRSSLSDSAALVEEARPGPLSFAEELARADQIRDSGLQGEAIWRYLRALQLDFKSPIPRQRIAFIHLGKDVARAEQIFRGLVRERPAMPSLRVGLGLAEYAMGKHELATQTLNFALALDSNSAVAMTALGLIEDAKGDHKAAQRHYTGALALEPLRYEIQNDAGMSLTMSGAFEQAVDAFAAAIFLDPGDPVVHNNLGFVLGKLRRYDEALESFKVFAAEGEALSNTGSMCFLNDDYQCAIDYYERALMKPLKEREQVLLNMRAAEDAFAHESGGKS